MKYRFIGTRTIIEGALSLTLNEFGQQVELPEDMVGGRRGLPVLTEEQFASCKFTDQELHDYRWPATHPDATPEFLAKKQKAIRLLQGVE